MSSRNGVRALSIALLLTCCIACGNGRTEASGPGAQTATTSMDASTGVPSAAPEAHTAPPACASKDTAEVSGTYTVPVSPELVPYATFDVQNVEFCEREGAVVLDYDLPALLVGKSTKISFRGASGSTAVYRLTGDNGTADCAAANGTWSCQEHLTGLQMDLPALDERLASLPPAEATGRRAVASVFGNDPIGVLTFATR